MVDAINTLERPRLAAHVWHVDRALPQIHLAVSNASLLWWLKLMDSERNAVDATGLNTGLAISWTRP